MKYEASLDAELGRYGDAERERISAARSWAAELHAGETRASGEPAVTHLERVAAILAGMGMAARSEARRGGTEWRSRWSPYH